MTAAVDAFAGQEGYDRSEAIRFILRDWLIGHGLLAPEPEPEEGAADTPERVRQKIDDLERSGHISPLNVEGKRKINLDD